MLYVTISILAACLNLLQAKFMEFKIQNMVGSCDVKFPIRLEGLVVQHQQFCRYFICYQSITHQSVIIVNLLIDVYNVNTGMLSCVAC